MGRYLGILVSKMPDGKGCLVSEIFRNKTFGSADRRFAAKTTVVAAPSSRTGKMPARTGRCHAAAGVCAAENEKLPMFAWVQRWFAQATDQAIIRVVATIVGLLAYIVWGGYSYLHPDHDASVACKTDCVTEFSSRHRAE
jgi:hypothetical protein